jgi:hypothetical protein
MSINAFALKNRDLAATGIFRDLRPGSFGEHTFHLKTETRFPARGSNARISLKMRHILALIALNFLFAGCAGPSGTGSQPKPGSGIAEYRQITREAHRSVAATVDSLDVLGRPNVKNSKLHSELARFDGALHQLELTSVKTRARAEAIITRGQAYFDEWKEQLATSTNQATGRAEAEQYARLLEHFDRIREHSADVRVEFRPFMAKLREFRATLDKPAISLDSASSQSAIHALTVSGHRVLDSLGAVSKSLDDAEVELRAAHASKQ